MNSIQYVGMKKIVSAAIVCAVFMIITTSVSAGKPSECSCPQMTADSIRIALHYQMENYPASQYRDVYKNFMQDFFGPGHILADTAASARYLRSELALDEHFDGPLFESTGYKGNFYRVNLSVIRDGMIDFPTFFDAFVESVQDVTPPDGQDWLRTWYTIDSVIKTEGIHFVNEDADRADLARQLAEGNYIVHHSKRFNDSTHFHYRIISSPVFHRRILPRLRAEKDN